MSKLGNLSVMRALGKALGIIDVRQAPSDLDTSAIKVVAGLDTGMIAEEQHQLGGQALIGGLSAWNWQAIGSDAGISTPVALNSPFATWRNNADRAAVILGLRIEIGFAGYAPIPAEVGKRMVLKEYRQANNSPVSVQSLSSFRPVFQVDPDRGLYVWSYPMWGEGVYSGSDPIGLISNTPIMAASPIYVPAGSRWGLSMQYWEPPGTNALAAWPAGTVVNVDIFLVSCPMGMRPPGM